MNNLEKYLDQVIEQKPAPYDVPLDLESDAPSQPKPNVLRSIAKRWYIVLGVLILVCAVGLPAIWFFSPPVFNVQGAVRLPGACFCVSPVMGRCVLSG